LIEFRRAQEAKDAVQFLNNLEIDGKKISVSIHTEYLQKQLNAKENKNSSETINYDSGASYIHTAQARSMLMQKLMRSRDMDPQAMGMKNIPGMESTLDDDGSTIRSQNFANLLPG